MKDEIIKKLIADKLRDPSPLVQLNKLHGDASYRTYSRALLADGRTYIIMQMPKGISSASEEITNFKGTHKELPFINVARFLKSKGIPVPKIFHYSEENGILILEDLGDTLMAQKVLNATTATRLDWYQKAIDLLIKIQESAKNSKASECIALERQFDATLLNWEFDHFLEYGIEARLDKKMSAGDLAFFKSETRAITSKIEAMPYGFTHRDFQSRNLIVCNGKLNVIDFQDALMGPAAYDLVALTRDSYIELSDEVLSLLIYYYAEHASKDAEKLRQEFDLITVQRKLKDAGRFVYIDRVKGNPDFLKFIPVSLGYVRKALERTPEHKELFKILTPYVPEWQ